MKTEELEDALSQGFKTPDEQKLVEQAARAHLALLPLLEKEPIPLHLTPVEQHWADGRNQLREQISEIVKGDGK